MDVCNWKSVNFALINSLCFDRWPTLLASWLPDGRLQGQEWVALNPTRNDTRAGSFKVNVETGKWADFATDDSGGDPVSLYAYLNGLSQVQAAKALQSELGIVE